MATQVNTRDAYIREFELLRKGAAFNLGPTSAQTIKIQKSEYPGIAEKIINVTFEVLADKIHEDSEKVSFTWKTPKTVWQMFKERHMPEWFKNRFPVHYDENLHTKTVTFKRYATYPKANVKIEKPSKIFTENLGGLEVIDDIVETK